MSDAATPRQGPPPEHEHRGRFAERYGERPLHLAGFAVTFGIAGYAALQIADLKNAFTVLVWFVGAILLHDLALYPAYTALDRAVQRSPVGINYVRVPALLSGLLFLVWFPLILERSPALYRSITGVEPPDYLARWLLITAALFAGSIAVALLRRARKPRGGRGAGAEDGVEHRVGV